MIKPCFLLILSGATPTVDEDPVPHQTCIRTAADKETFINSFAVDIGSEAPHIKTIKKGLVVWLHSQNKDKKDFITTTKKLIDLAHRNSLVNQECVNFEALKRSVHRVVMEANKKINLLAQGANFVQKISEDIVIPVQTCESTRCEEPLPTTVEPVDTNDTVKFSDDGAASNELPGSVVSIKRSLWPQQELLPSPKKLKMDCSECKKKRKTIQKLAQTNKDLKKQLDNVYVSSNEGRCLRQALGGESSSH